LKHFTIAFFLLASLTSKAQQIDSIYVNLYTDSLKKGTYNYINVDGLASDGSYLPLDSTHVIFTSNYGHFYGNTLWIEDSLHKDEVEISVCLRQNPARKKTFSLYIKQAIDPPLKTEEEVIAEMRKARKKND
jgi:hypothetical protein